jgi:hypothetical protein
VKQAVNQVFQLNVTTLSGTATAQPGATDLEEGKLRSALLLGKLPGDHDDWLICMLSSQIRHFVPRFDELIQEQDSDFAQSGLKSCALRSPSAPIPTFPRKRGKGFCARSRARLRMTHPNLPP